MAGRITEKTIQQFVEEVSDQHHAMAGAVIAASGAQAAALGEACMQISLDHQVDILDWQDVTARIEQMAGLKSSLIEWCNQDGAAITEYATLPESNNNLEKQRSLCDSPAAISRLSISAVKLLEDFRPLVLERVQDDLEMSIVLLTNTARTAMLLLDSNLRIWPDSALLKEYEPILAELETQINQLTPVNRIRS